MFRAGPGLYIMYLCTEVSSIGFPVPCESVATYFSNYASGLWSVTFSTLAKQ